MKKEALLFEKIGNNAVHCFLCAHECHIQESGFGFCGVRQNIGGDLFTHVYGNPCAMHADPIEKKPLFHFLPGSSSFSIATVGCNFHCGFCQNWQISQALVDSSQDAAFVAPADIVSAALARGCSSIAYTYTEPTIFFEYALDIARIAKKEKLYNVFVTNGFMTPQALKLIRPYLDAANVDLKFFRDDSYRTVCKGRLSPVLDSIKLMKEMGIWLEITTLIVPDKNDSQEELRDIAGFIAGVCKDIPWHVSRFHPDYRFMDTQTTPESTIKLALRIGHDAGLNYVYPGNAREEAATVCPSCKKILIKRAGYSILEDNIRANKCSFCANTVAGFFNP